MATRQTAAPVADPASSKTSSANAEPWGTTKLWYRQVEEDGLDRVGEARAAALAVANSGRAWRFLRDMPLGLVLYDDQFRIVYQNLASEVMTGYPSSDFAGQSPIGLWIPESQRTVIGEILRRMREERVALHGRAVHVRRDGRLSWVQWHTTPLFDGDCFIGYLGTHSELSEAVRAAKHQAELLIDAAVDIAMVQLSPQGRILSWNRNAAALFDSHAKEALGLPFEMLFSSDGAECGVSASLLARARDGDRTEYEGWLGRTRETRFWGHLRLYPQRDDDDVVYALVMVARDLSERRRAEQQVRESEALLSAIVSAASDVILGIDDADRVILCNPAAERVFGRSAAQLKDGPLPDILPRGDGLRSLVDARRTLSGVGHDGRMQHLEVSATRTSVEGRSFITLVARDVTERVESEQAVERYREQLSALTRDLMDAEQKTNRRLAQLLHDQFGQTLTSLRIFVDAVRARLPASDDAIVQNGWSQISSLIDRGMREVREVLVELRPALLQEQGLAVALDNEVQAQAAKHPEVRVTLDAADELAERRWAPDVEYAVFMVAREAIANALLHSRGGHVAVRLDARGMPGLVLSVHDDGRGLGPAERAHKPGHLGLVGMRERALGIGAQLVVSSSAGRRGTTIELRYAP
ncbi:MULTISPECIES: sensor histidine kinase [Burkholderia]|uniref:sensor histidine kinase n=1 Tax=Burkholderia TaxID=32008 RepID=UPI0005319E0C|nr:MULTISPECIES: PAS domain S-box protein [Burkholderia]KGS08674.1 sensory box protein [Burkholderia sp. ABCPW 111]